MEGDLQLQFENRYIRKDGRIAHISWTARWLPDLQLRLAVAHDITERKLHETRQAAIYAISEATHAAQSLESLFSASTPSSDGWFWPPTSRWSWDQADGALRHAYHANEYRAAPCSSDALCAEVGAPAAPSCTPARTPTR